MSGSIKDRMATQLQFNEKQIWNGFLHSGKDILPYLSKNYFGDYDAVFVLFDGTVLDGDSIEEYLTETYGVQKAKWMSYDMDDMQTIEVDMMAGVIYYGVLATRVESEFSLRFFLFFFPRTEFLEKTD